MSKVNSVLLIHAIIPKLKNIVTYRNVKLLLWLNIPFSRMFISLDLILLLKKNMKNNVTLVFHFPNEIFLFHTYSKKIGTI